MIILPCLPMCMTFNYIGAIFLLVVVFGFVWHLLKGGKK